MELMRSAYDEMLSMYEVWDREEQRRLNIEKQTSMTTPSIEHMPWEQETPPVAEHTLYFPGQEASPTTTLQPCEPAFVHALLNDLASWAWRAFSPTVENHNLHIENDLEIFTQIMDQCRRIQSCPDLMPSEIIKDEFLIQIAKVSTQLAAVVDAEQQLETQETDEDLDENWSDEGMSDCDTDPKLPEFYPNRPGGKCPWNDWLDNSAQATSGWIAIQQKIPRIGDRLCRRLTLMYHAVELDFRQTGRIVRDPTNEPAKIKEAGDNYKHMEWSGFTTVWRNDLGFPAGTRNPMDFDGMMTLEYISQWLTLVEDLPFRGRIRPFSRDLGPANCPYFRFAVAYKP